MTSLCHNIDPHPQIKPAYFDDLHRIARATFEFVWSWEPEAKLQDRKYHMNYNKREFLSLQTKIVGGLVIYN